MNTPTPFKDTLLVVDDTPDNVKILFTLLSSLGYKVLIAQNGKEAICRVKEVKPSLILLDIMMPVMDGFEACKILKSNDMTKDIPIIFITALTNTESKIKGFELGGADYITKPFHREEVAARIATQLKLYKLNKTLQEEIIIRKEYEDSLQYANTTLAERTKELEQRNMELEAFAHMVAHDLKNPLSPVVGLANFLLETTEEGQPADKQLIDKLRVIEQSGQQAVDIINALLLLAGVSRQTQPSIESLNMETIVKKVLEIRLAYMIENYSASVMSLTSLKDLSFAKGYAPWIEEIWINYLSNGLKYGGQPPRLELGADEEIEMIRFWVRDNGQGLTEQQQACLFTPFTRLHKGCAEGHGLGLSIVQKIVERLGGKVGVESSVGKGCLFYFTLPKDS